MALDKKYTKQSYLDMHKKMEEIIPSLPCGWIGVKNCIRLILHDTFKKGFVEHLPEGASFEVDMGGTDIDDTPYMNVWLYLGDKKFPCVDLTYVSHIDGLLMVDKDEQSFIIKQDTNLVSLIVSHL